MSLVTQAFLFEKYGPRLNAEQLAEVLGISKAALYNQISAGTCGVKTYLDFGQRWADYRDAANHLDAVMAHVREKVATFLEDYRAEVARLMDIRRIESMRNAAAHSRLVRMRRAVAWADRKAMSAFYREARRLTAETGIKHHVDHIIPLRGEFVSGLHVESNLRVITATENIRKTNKFEVEAC